MQNFIQRAADIALQAQENGEPTDSSDAFAVRLFTVVAVLGGMDCIDDTVGESLAVALSKAPTDVLAAGTMALLMQRAGQL